MFAPSVAPAERRPAGPARRDRRERRGRESDQDRMRRRRRRERRGLPSEERKRKDPKRGNQPNPHSTRKWQQAAAAEAAPHYFLHRLRGYRRHGHRLLQALSPPPPPCIVANEGHATGSLPFIGCCRTSLGPRSSAAAGRSVRWPRNQIEEGERPTDRASFKRFLPSGYDFLTAAAPVGGGQHEVRTDGGAGHSPAP